MRRRACRLAATIAVVLAAPRAQAAACVASAGGPRETAAVTLADLDGRFPELRARLAKGLAVTILHAVRAGEGRSFSFGCKLLYDLWDEAYLVTPLVGSVVVQQKAERVGSLESLPLACRSVRLPWSLEAGAEIEVESALDPISDEQVERTRQWLAERGIGGGGGPLGFGRAALSLVDLKATQTLTRTCAVQGRSP